MKAIICSRYGGPEVLQLQDMPKPSPAPGEVLIKVAATALNAADWRLMRADPFIVRLMMGFFRPRHNILGADVAGTVEQVGEGVSEYRPGDRVFGDLSGAHFGGLAEYVCGPVNLLAKIPENISFEDAAASGMAALTALQGLRDYGQVQAGQKVLINGASGGVGTFAVQIAKACGADVTAVCSTSKLDLARELGADQVIDYKKEDFTKSNQLYDLIFAANGNRPIRHYQRALKPRGTYLMIGGGNRQMFEVIFLGPWLSMFSDKSMGSMTAKGNAEDQQVIGEMLASEKVKPVIDRRYMLEDTSQAFEYLEKGHAAGKVVVIP